MGLPLWRRLACCVFWSIVTDRFGIVTAEFGNVTERFGDVTAVVLKAVQRLPSTCKPGGRWCCV